MECKKTSNLESCSCTYTCSLRGICCDCVSRHIKSKQIPGCFFPEKAEKTYDRSFKHFASLINNGEI